MDEDLDVAAEQQSRINFVTCLKWVKKGVARCQPEKVQLSKNELIEVIKDTQNKLKIGQNDGNQPNEDEFKFEEYDEDDEQSTANALGISSIAELNNNAEDNFSESDDSDKEDEIIKPNDNLILVGHVEGDASTLEVYVYNEEEESLYVHHDLLLPSFPLYFEWLNFEPGAPQGSYCAVGTMEPLIQVWDLDIINCIEPAFTLGKKANKRKNIQQSGHTDAVLALAWNTQHQHVLASGSVDQTVLLWDLETLTPTTEIRDFSEKIQVLQWHPTEPTTILSGSADGLVKIIDCRTQPATFEATFQLAGETETAVWDPLDANIFYAGSNVGSLQCFDRRKGQLWTTNAHEKEVTGLVASEKCPGFVITGSQDGVVKIWDCNPNAGAELVQEKDFSLGAVHCLGVSPELPFVAAIGGDNKINNFTVFDLRNLDTVNHKFGTRESIQES